MCGAHGWARVLPLITGPIAPTRAVTLTGSRTLQNVIVVKKPPLRRADAARGTRSRRERGILTKELALLAATARVRLRQNFRAPAPDSPEPPGWRRRGARRARGCRWVAVALTMKFCIEVVMSSASTLVGVGVGEGNA